MKKLVLMSALSVLMFNNSQAQSFKPKSAREAFASNLMKALPTENDDTVSIMPPQIDYTSLILLLPTENDAVNEVIEIMNLKKFEEVSETKSNKAGIVFPVTNHIHNANR